MDSARGGGRLGWFARVCGGSGKGGDGPFDVPVAQQLGVDLGAQVRVLGAERVGAGGARDLDGGLGFAGGGVGHCVEDGVGLVPARLTKGGRCQPSEFAGSFGSRFRVGWVVALVRGQRKDDSGNCGRGNQFGSACGGRDWALRGWLMGSLAWVAGQVLMMGLLCVAIAGLSSCRGAIVLAMLSSTGCKFGTSASSLG